MRPLYYPRKMVVWIVEMEKWLTSPRIAKIKENNKNEEAQK